MPINKKMNFCETDHMTAESSSLSHYSKMNQNECDVIGFMTGMIKSPTMGYCVYIVRPGDEIKRAVS